jgi:hypothetical protein
MKAVGIISTILMVVGCSSSQSVMRPDASSAEHVRIIVAFYNWFYLPADVPQWGQLAAEVNGVAPPARDRTYYFVEVFEADAPSLVLQALSRDGAVFLPGSQFSRGKGVRFFVDTIDLISPTRVVLTGGHWFHELGGRRGTYEMRKEDGTWRVVETIRESIS